MSQERLLCNAKLEEPPNINYTNNNMVAIVVKYIQSMHTKSGDSAMRVTFQMELMQSMSSKHGRFFALRMK